MPQNFLSCDRDQPLLLPPEPRDWLAEDRLAWFVIEAVDEIDLEPLYCAYRQDGHGRAAHEPKMMVRSWPPRTRSASAHRGASSAAAEDVAFLGDLREPGPRARDDRPLSGPPRSGPRGSVQRRPRPLRRGGARRGGVLAVDRTELAASASNHATSSYEQIAAEIPAEAGRRRGRALRRCPRRRAARASGEPRRTAGLASRGQGAPRARAGRKPGVGSRERSKRLSVCRDRPVSDWRAERRANRDYEAYRGRGVMCDGRRFGAPPKPYTPPEQPAHTPSPPAQALAGDPVGGPRKRRPARRRGGARCR
jgi:hypothetical protein